MGPLGVASTLWRTYGARGVALRAVHELRLAAGLFRGAPRHQLAIAPAGTLALDLPRLAASLAADAATVRARAQAVCSGRFLAYGHAERPLPSGAAGWAAGWHAGKPWWRVPHLDLALGDIKDVWEPARFGWMYDLIRAFALTGDERYAAEAARRVTDFAASCPPFRGPQWACGQETAIRAVALAYADAAFHGTAAWRPAREVWARLMGWSGERVADALGYAISQRNNHGLSEATGLLVCGATLRGLHPEAAAWERRGERWLARLAAEQFAPDGWYIQHSFNYLRLAADQLIVALRVIAARGALAPEAIVRPLGAALDLLCAVMAEDGTVPNHGANDGSWVHPTSTVPSNDFRPCVTALAAVTGAPLPADVRPDEQTLAWLSAPAPTRAPARPHGVRQGVSGWAVARTGDALVFLQAGRYASRPGHADALHCDVRGPRGPVVVDPGTFRYAAPAPWRNGLSDARVHNGPLVDGRESGRRGPRFLWLEWPSATLERATWDGKVAVLMARSNSGVERTVTVGAGEVEVLDRVTGPARHALMVLWTLADGVDAAMLRLDGTVRERRGEEGDVVGWISTRYGERHSTLALESRSAPAVGASLRASVTL